MEPGLYYSDDYEIYIVCSPTKHVYTICIDTNTLEMVVRTQSYTRLKRFNLNEIPITSPSFPIIVN